MIDKEIESRVLEYIAKATEPIHNTEIARALDLNRVTATKYLSVLYSKGLISFKKVGMAKVWAPTENPVLLAFEINDEDNTTIQAFNGLDECVSVLDKDYEIVWYNKAMEKMHGKLSKLKGKKCYSMFHQEKDVCKNCPITETFETGKAKRSSMRKNNVSIEMSTAPLKGKAGKILAVIKVARMK